MLKIVHIPNKVLISKAKPVEKIDESITKLVKEMQKTLAAQVDPQGVGLAAPQVGVSLALYIMQPFPDSPFEVAINPRILEQKNLTNLKTEDSEEHEQLEGCLSIPRIWSPIKRHDRVLLEFQDLTGKKKTKWYEDFEATIVQHEVDHLNGILFTQRAIEQNERLFEEKNGKLKKIEM